MANHRIMAVHTSNSNKIQHMLKPVYTWINSTYLHAQHWANIWFNKRRIARNSKMLESLPNHILKDIGWPNINEDLCGPQ